MDLDVLKWLGAIILGMLGALGVNRARSKTNRENAMDQGESRWVEKVAKERDVALEKLDAMREQFVKEQRRADLLAIDVMQNKHDLELIKTQTVNLTKAAVKHNPNDREMLTGPETGFSDLEDEPSPPPRSKPRK